jgi:hypothetical protein
MAREPNRHQAHKLAACNNEQNHIASFMPRADSHARHNLSFSSALVGKQYLLLRYRVDEWPHRLHSARRRSSAIKQSFNDQGMHSHSASSNAHEAYLPCQGEQERCMVADLQHSEHVRQADTMWQGDRSTPCKRQPSYTSEESCRLATATLVASQPAREQGNIQSHRQAQLRRHAMLVAGRSPTPHCT